MWAQGYKTTKDLKYYIAGVKISFHVDKYVNFFFHEIEKNIMHLTIYFNKVIKNAGTGKN